MKSSRSGVSSRTAGRNVPPRLSISDTELPQVVIDVFVSHLPPLFLGERAERRMLGTRARGGTMAHPVDELEQACLLRGQLAGVGDHQLGSGGDAFREREHPQD